MDCPHHYCRDCVGCEYSIYDISFFTYIIDLINHAYLELKQAKTDGSSSMIRHKITNTLLPTAFEILSIAKTQYGYEVDTYASKIIEIMDKRGIEYDHTEYH